MGEEAAIGGSGKSGKALRDALRSVKRSDEEQAKRLVDGSAMRDLLSAIERASDHLLAFPIQESATPGELRAQAMRYLLGLVQTGIAQTSQLSDPNYPKIIRSPDSETKWGAENVDNQYLWCRVSPESSYLVRGNRENVFEALLETKDGYMQLGDDQVFDTLLLTDCQCEANGDFEILLAAEKPSDWSGNFMAMPPETQYWCVRQYFADWEVERPARFEIERIDGLGIPALPLEAHRMADYLDEAALWIEQTTVFWQEWVTQLRDDHEKGRLMEAAPFVGGADDIVYGNDWWSLDLDEAMIVEFEAPDARYWQIQLCDVWFRTMDWATHQTGLNHTQAWVHSDGRARFVFSAEDPGVQNWIDTMGTREGMIQYRYIWSKNRPAPSVTICKFADLKSHLPADTPSFDEEARRAQLAIRHRHVARREPVT
ncbi:MAG: hypothetical protein CL931_00800 [Deltaproteobacteria bacterium]|nr:hypothetical protein [Deltaproteobacteria bacterium]